MTLLPNKRFVCIIFRKTRSVISFLSYVYNGQTLVPLDLHSCRVETKIHSKQNLAVAIFFSNNTKITNTIFVTKKLFKNIEFRIPLDIFFFSIFSCRLLLDVCLFNTYAYCKKYTTYCIFIK